jgi:hypothetical protein
VGCGSVIKPQSNVQFSVDQALSSTFTSCNAVCQRVIGVLSRVGISWPRYDYIYEGQHTDANQSSNSIDEKPHRWSVSAPGGRAALHTLVNVTVIRMCINNVKRGYPLHIIPLLKRSFQLSDQARTDKFDTREGYHINMKAEREITDVVRLYYTYLIGTHTNLYSLLTTYHLS